MKNVVTHFDVNQPTGKVHPDGMAILGGDAPVWKYCGLFHRCVTDGAAVVAIAHGIDTRTNSSDAVVAYSTDPRYQVGKTLGDADRVYMEKRCADPNYRAELQAAVDAGNTMLRKTIC